MLDWWYITEEKIGSMPKELKTPKEKRQFLATSNLSPEVRERFTEAQVATQNGGNKMRH